MSHTTNSTRDVILVMIKKNPELTVSTIADELNITKMAVRRHLQGLEKDGVICSKLERQPMGRPTQKYSLTTQGEESFPRNYGHLSLEILKDIEKLSGESLIEQLFEQRRSRLEAKYEPEVKGNLEQRVHALARIQNESGYMVEVEPEDDGTFRFIEYNCPIAQVASAYPIACTCEKKLFQTLLDTDQVEREECLAKETTSSCVYVIKNDGKND